MMIHNEQAMIHFGTKLARLLSQGMVIYLEGPLGSGKTTLARGILQGLGHTTRVKSPSFSIVEPYHNLRVNLYHFDLYRIASGDELEYIGIRDYLNDGAVLLFEWPEHGEGHLPLADLKITISMGQNDRTLSLEAYSEDGELLLSSLS